MFSFRFRAMGDSVSWTHFQLTSCLIRVCRGSCCARALWISYIRRVKFSRCAQIMITTKKKNNYAICSSVVSALSSRVLVSRPPPHWRCPLCLKIWAVETLLGSWVGSARSGETSEESTEAEFLARKLIYRIRCCCCCCCSVCCCSVCCSSSVCRCTVCCYCTVLLFCVVVVLCCCCCYHDYSRACYCFVFRVYRRYSAFDWSAKQRDSWRAWGLVTRTGQHHHL